MPWACAALAAASGITLVNKSQGDRISRGLLDICGKAGNRRAVTDIGRRHVQCEQVAQRIDGQVHFRPALALRAVIAGTRAAFRC